MLAEKSNRESGEQSATAAAQVRLPPCTGRGEEELAKGKVT
jgi:hypothetical protein